MSIKNKKLTTIITGAGLALSAGFIIGIGGFFGGGATIPTDTMTRGLVGNWSMDEGFGSTAYDATTYQNNGSLGGGTAANMPQWTQGKVGGALSFDGVNDYVDAGNGASLNALADTMTIEAWIKPNSIIPTYPAFIQKYSVGDGWILTAVSTINGGKTLFLIDGTSIYRYSGNNALTVGSWTHVVYIKDGSNLHCYINGALSDGTSSGDPSALGTNTQNLKIGTGQTGYFDGTIDDVRIYNRALSASEIRYHYNRGGPVAQWSFDEGSGSVAYDATESNNDGTLYGGMATSTADGSGWKAGKYGSALAFDGVNDYVDVGNSNSIMNLTGEFSIEFWTKVNNFTAITGLVSSFDKFNGYGWGIPVSSSGNKLELRRSYGVQYLQDIAVSGTLQTGTWYHIVGLYDGTYLKIYVDGVLFGTPKAVTSTAFIKGTGITATIGRAYPGDYFNGLIDDVRIYSYARTPDEIALDYNAGFAAKVGGTWDFNQGQVGYWAMDEGTGQTAYDISGNNNNGTLGASTSTGTDDPTWTTQGKVGGALQFDGVDDYVNAGSGASLNIPASDFTIEAWIKPNNASAAQAIVGKVAFSPNSWGLYQNVGKFVFQFRGTGASVDTLANAVYGVGTWYHVVGVRTGNVNNLYINGIVQTDADTSTDIPSTGTKNFIFGKRTSTDDDYYFNGLMDEVRIYNRALSAEEIRYHYNHGGPVGYWKFDEGTGSTAYDSSGNINTGTLYGGMATSTADGSGWKAGKYGSALAFDGVNDYVNAANEANFDFERTNPFTFSAWVKSSSATYQFIICKSAAAEPYRGPSILLRNTGIVDFILTNDNAANNLMRIVSTNTVNDGKWHHIVGTYNGNSHITGMNIYIDGVLETPQLTSDNLTATILNDVNIQIGTRSSTYFFNGLIDEARIYNYARTPDEIKLDYNGGFAMHFGPQLSCDDDPGACMTQGLAGYWSMDEGTGQTAWDSSGSNNNGTLGTGSSVDVSDPAWAQQGKVGGALSFDGVNDYVKLPKNFDSLTDTSVEVWFQYVTVSTRTELVAFYKDSNNLITLYVDEIGKKVALYNKKEATVGSIISDNAVTAGTWYHVVVILGSGGMKMYINGILQTQTSAVTTTPADIAPHIADMIGTRISVYGFWSGLIDDVRIYNRALTAAEVRYHYNRGAPVALWKFEEGEGQTAFDSTENNNDGRLGSTTAADAADPTWIQGKYGSALSFDGVDDYVDAGNGASLGITNAITIEAWIKPNNVAATQGIVLKSQDAFGYKLEIYQSKLNAYVYGPNKSNAGTNLLVNNVWQHVAFTYDGSNLITWINGSLDKSVAASGSITSSSNDHLWIGNYANTYFFNGLIDDVRIYNYARSASQIQQDYNEGFSVRL